MTDDFEPLYSLKVAANRIPFSSVESLYVFLSKHRDLFPARYKRAKRGYIRLLSLSECKRIRAMVVFDTRSRKERNARKLSSPSD